jgi:hypothetical protein
MAISSAIAGVKNINFADGAVAQEMVDYVRRYHETFNKEYPKKD